MIIKIELIDAEQTDRIRLVSNRAVWKEIHGMLNALLSIKEGKSGIAVEYMRGKIKSGVKDAIKNLMASGLFRFGHGDKEYIFEIKPDVKIKNYRVQ